MLEKNKEVKFEESKPPEQNTLQTSEKQVVNLELLINEVESLLLSRDKAWTLLVHYENVRTTLETSGEDVKLHSKRVRKT